MGQALDDPRPLDEGDVDAQGRRPGPAIQEARPRPKRVFPQRRRLSPAVQFFDNGSAWYLSGVPDDRWDNDDLVSELAAVKDSDFEAVDVSSLMLDPDASQIVPRECAAPAEVELSDTSVVDRDLHRACETNSVGPNVSILGPDGDAVLSAGSRVVLLPGTAVFNGGRLEVATGLPLIEE